MKDKALGPFDIVNSISKGDPSILDNDQFNKAYVPFVINRHLSYFPDALLCANMMNSCPNLDKDMQFLFYINTVKPRTRFTKWAKPETYDDLEVIKKCFNVSNAKAKEISKILTKEELDAIRQEYNEVLNE